MANPDPLDALRAELVGLGSGGGAAASEPTVVLDRGRGAKLRKNDITSDGAVIQRPRSGQGRRAVGASEAEMEFYRWSDSERSEWGQYLVGLGVLSSEQADDFTTLYKAWQESVKESANFAIAGKVVTPREAAEMLAAGARASGPFSGTKTQTSTNVDLTDPTTARALVNQVLTNQLGRAATDDEIDRFTQILNTAERANPTLTTTTGTYEQGDLVSQSSTTQGGLTAAARQELVSDKVTATPEYGAYQAATTYFNTLLQGIGAVV